SRAQHFEEIIEPALAGGRLILCDRFWDATFAYQGQGRNLDLKPLKSFQAFVTGKVTPDLTLLLDVEVRR
ncbi:MAG: dTMP kinase, partial [Planctomycetales bacterium]|nr:dTMP kinase [Planctomycetales bacterium]